MRTILGLVVIVMCVASTTAFADGLFRSFSKPEDFLCGSEYVVVGTVLKATPTRYSMDTSLEGTFIYDCSLHLEVEITEILGAKSEVMLFSRHVGAVTGQTLRFITLVYDTEMVPQTENQGHIGFIPRTTDPQKIVELLQGKQFIFSFRPFRPGLGRWERTLSLEDQLEGRLLNQPYFTYAWRIDRRDWVMEVLRQSKGILCPTLIAPRGDGQVR